MLVEMGLHPRSAATNAFFLVYGGAWLALTGAFILGQSWARWGIFAAALGSLWYLGPGTLISLAVMVLVLFARR